MTKLTPKSETVAGTDDLISTIHLSLSNSLIQPASNYVDEVVKHKMRLTYGYFISLSDLILTHDKIDSMVEYTRTAIPTIWRAVQDILGYSDAYMKKGDNDEMFAPKRHLHKTYSRSTFYEIMALSRVRNDQHFAYWASLGTAAAYANSTSETSARIPAYFGLRA